MPKSLGSDNHSGVHPEILQAICCANSSHAPSYGTDKQTQKCQEIFKYLFGSNTQMFFVFNGTAANVLCLRNLIQSYQSVICADTSHLNIDECGAPENYIGCKLLTIKTNDGKITTQQIKEKLIRLGDQHHSQPGAVSITQPTELGTVYNLEEMKAIKDFCRVHNLKLHIDGSRLIYGAHYLNCELKEFSSLADSISFGGTKNGLLFGEAVLFFDQKLAKNFKFIRKQGMQLPSKSRFLAAQFIALLDPQNNLWKTIAKQGHDLALYLESQVKQIPEIEITQKVQANSVFCTLPKHWIKPLKETSFFYIWNEHTFEARWMLSFDSKKEDIDLFVKKLQSLSVKS